MHHVISLTRSVATLASAAALLAAAAGPANAQVLPGTISRDAPDAPSTLRWSLGPGGDDRGASLSLKFDSNEMAELHASQPDSLGRENAIGHARSGLATDGTSNTIMLAERASEPTQPSEAPAHIAADGRAA